MIKFIITICLFSLSSITFSQSEKPIVRKGFVFGAALGVSYSYHSFPQKHKVM